MAALLPVSHQSAVGQPQQQSRIVLRRVPEFDHAARRHVGRGGNAPGRTRRAVLPPTHGSDPTLPCHERAAGEHEKFGEFAPCQPRFVRCTIGESVQEK